MKAFLLLGFSGFQGPYFSVPGWDLQAFLWAISSNPEVDYRGWVWYDSGMEHKENQAAPGFKEILYEVIFKSDTPAGKLFDVVLIVCILISVLVVMLDSVGQIHEQHVRILVGLEWFFTLLFSIEYLFRLYCVRSRLKYALSFFGIVDLLAILPTYLSLFLFHTRYLMVIRILRVLRVFRVLKMAHHVQQANLIVEALSASRRKIFVFLSAILVLVVIIGSLMYLIEGPANGFTSIPISVYWAVVTLTTVGYGDISPVTPPGQALAAVVMLLGYSIIAVPTGIVTSQIAYKAGRKYQKMRCSGCDCSEHETDAVYCKQCGQKLQE